MRLIDADALMDKTDDRYSLGEIGRRERDDIINALEFAPTIKPEPRKKGKWIYYDPNGFKCSRCGGYLEIGCGDVKMNFCPNCGSYNRGEEE